MARETDLNISPYGDDFDENKNFHQILFRPNVVVQARELTQLQTILQNQIERFGDNIFTAGTIIKGCSFSYDANYHYAKLRDIRVDLNPTVVSDLVGLTAVDPSSGLSAIVVNAVDGFETQNPDTKTIYLKYMNTGTGQKKEFLPGDTLNFYSNGTLQSALTVQILPATLNLVATNAVGTGYAFSVSDGIIYQKGFFVRVDNGLTAIISKYSSAPTNVVVGFQTTESIITENSDTSLNDNASGFTNENAPGAHRLKLTPKLVTYAANSIPTAGFFVLVEWENGQVVRENRNSSYNVLGQEFARRTSEESGDYVVNPFVVTTSNISGNTTHLNLNTTQGLAYVSGYRVEKTNNLSTPVRKATDTDQLTSQQIVANYGNYVICNEMSGHFNPNLVETINLNDTAGKALSTSLAAGYAPGSVIGTARLLAVTTDNGALDGLPTTTYRFYITNIRMNAGQNFMNVKSLSSASLGVADLVLENNIAVLKDPSFQTLIYPFGQGSVKTLRNGANNNNSFIFRTQNANTKILASGVSGLISLSGGQVFPYGIGTLNDVQERSIMVIPTTGANVALTKSGTVTVANNNTAVTGTGTAFQSEYQVGDFIYINTQYRQIVGIANNTSLTVANTFTVASTANTHAKYYPANTAIPFSGRNSTISLANSSTMALALFASNGAIETLSSNLNIIVYYDVKINSAVQLGKTVLKNQYIKIDCSNNLGNTVGPWCLGLPDVYQITGVYKSNNYTESAATDVTSQFVLDNGQRDMYYAMANMSRVPGTTLSLASTDKLLVKVNVLKPNLGSGQGFFSVDSYPIDDANTANTNAITTQEIPIFQSPKSGLRFELRDCVDFRPIGSNNALYAANAASATINPANTLVFDSNENYVVSPNATFGAGLEYYLSRVDKLVLDTSGEFTVVEGNPSINPTPPADVPGAMTVAVVTVAPYPSLSMKDSFTYNRSKMAVGLRDQQIGRFTMKDLRKINTRLENLENYTSLNVLEKATSDLVIKDQSGLDRFKNGIFVDDFNDTAVVAIDDKECRAIVDTSRSVVRSDWNQQTIELKYSAGSNVASSEVVSLAYTENTLINQPLTSTDRSLGGVSWDFTPPTTEIYPPYDPIYDENKGTVSVQGVWWWFDTDPVTGNQVKIERWQDGQSTRTGSLPNRPNAYLMLINT